MTPSRRDVLKTLPVIAAATLTTHAAESPATPSPGLTVRMSDPVNLETDFSAQTTFITPTEQFFVRSHFAVPSIAEQDWQLTIAGAVEKPLSFTLKQIQELPRVTLPLTLECAGNGRVFLTPPTRGLQWQQGAVSTAEWTGVTLKSILDLAGVKPTAKEVILVGGDKGTVADPVTPGAIAFDRSIPLEKALKPECILAYSMNGQSLTPAHGYPLRVVIGGWYGMAAIKWLTRIVVSDTPYEGFWQTLDYSYWTRRDGNLATLNPITAMQPKAQIAKPTFGETLTPSTAYMIRGAAWAGENAVAKVEVSTDGGSTWTAANLTGEAKPFCWRAWELEWNVPAAAGTLKLLCRCVDDKGQGQPEKRDPDRRTYVINHPLPVEVTVAVPRKSP